MIKLAEIIPQSLHDEQILALCEGLDAQLEMLEAQSQLVLHLPRLDELPHEVLDKLAWQYHVDFYSDKFTLQMKRDLIRQSFFVHRIKGTPRSVEKFLSAVMADVKVSEWFEYGGEPYLFRITTGGLKLELDDDGEFLRLINESKNLRSWLEKITFDLTLEENHTYYAVETESFAEREVEDLDTAQEDSATRYHSVTEQLSDFEFEDYPTEFELADDVYCNVVECESGFEIVEADYSDDFTEIFYRICRERWQRWRDNPVVEHYHHHNHDFDDDVEPLPLPVDKDFLRLYLDFDGGYERYLTILHPREDITADDINAFGAWLVDHEVLLNSSGYLATGIKRALLIQKESLVFRF